MIRGLDLDRRRIDTAFRRFDKDRSDHLDDGELARLAAYLGFEAPNLLWHSPRHALHWSWDV